MGGGGGGARVDLKAINQNLVHLYYDKRSQEILPSFLGDSWYSMVVRYNSFVVQLSKGSPYGLSKRSFLLMHRHPSLVPYTFIYISILVDDTNMDLQK
ncbi:hypothetical protein M0802_003233 [Mischocyttarus mexicanus]|nr:hypothetical protein M0802_003233 [Mischocyttarus mexicanus]